LKNKIFVTQPFLPPIEEYVKILTRAWDNKWLTNEGELHKEFEEKLCSYLGVKYISLFNNATIALFIAQKAMYFKGDIITTPYSFIATAHSIKWNGLNPIFVDTDDQVGNLLPKNVEEAITDKTGGILAVHNYGIPGDLEGMQDIAKKYNLPLIYDAAPAMGVNYKGNTILQYGDLAVLSFHATKVFTTFEGGAIISRSVEMKEKIDQLKNFAILGPEIVSGLGINGKMNEAEAAMGLLQLKYIDKNIKKRKEIFKFYVNSLKSRDEIILLDIPNIVEYNYAYFPIFFVRGLSIRDEIHDIFIANNIICRKYWYPLITDHDIYSKCNKHNLVNSRKLSNSTLCLPIYPDLTKSEQNYIIDILIEELT
jgi:dTDP-4-amino-4,6-dideoxygalactose transaminase